MSYKRRMLVLAAAHGALGAFMAVLPSRFASLVGGYGALNQHFVRDNAATNLAFALALTAAARRPQWARPTLLVIAAQYWFHAASHAVDAGAARPPAVGVATAAVLTLISVVWTLAATRAPQVEVPT